ncbi:DUF4126 family protein [Terriglobus roseus]|uniref:Uncharacterized membrane protein n=1 Tax=Terriglobus roseus TaxID=392734 RepID=A0A1G7NV70_9BACT|nr:DUF4126 family protein [Terriglobus roseus]SDF77924.1 Uncharacterized membrane protein [Terriglobus roseus]
MNLLLVALLGGCSGLRTFTPLAVLCWFAWRNVIHFSGWRNFTASLITVIIVTVIALGELINDKLPKTPSRLIPPQQIARMTAAGFVGLLVAQPLLLSPILAIVTGAIGAVVGTYTGWFVRSRTVAALKCPDLPIALLEDAVAIGLSITFLHLIAVHSVLFLGNQGIGFGK